MSSEAYQFTCDCGKAVEQPLAKIPAACPTCGALWVMEWDKSPIVIEPK